MENNIDWLKSFAPNDLVNFFDATMEDQDLFDERVVSIIEDTLVLTLMVIRCIWYRMEKRHYTEKSTGHGI